VKQYAQLVKIEKGRIEINNGGAGEPKMWQRIGPALQEATGERWIVSISSARGAATIAEQDAAQWIADVEQMKTNPEIAEILSIFPDADAGKIRGY